MVEELDAGQKGVLGYRSLPLVESELGAIVARANQIFRPLLK
jgi:hypothetical protein